jgi:uncharacterized protein YdeI (YjbR/CyaY-like superfamily)
MSTKKLLETGTTVPTDLRSALLAVCEAEATWKDLTPISRRDYISWINEAKQEETRARRIKRCVENLVKGKRRPCCYAVVPMDLYKALGDDPKAKAQWSELSADEKRDISDWVEASGDKQERKDRIKGACAKLATGKRKVS